MNQRVGSKKLGYWASRNKMAYYAYVDLIVRRVGITAKSLIDIGARDAQYIEEFDWIPNRSTLDIVKPYSSPTVEGIQANFFEWTPTQHFDVALCLQVLEHVEMADRFAQKLLSIADRVVVSVPYKWPEWACKYHVHDPVDLEKLSGWFNREPDYHIVVQEPLWRKATGRRLIAYFHDDPSSFEVDAFRKRA